MNKVQSLAAKTLAESWDCAVHGLQPVDEKPARQCLKAVTDRGDLFVKIQDLAANGADDILNGQKVQRFLAEHGVEVSEILPAKNGLDYVETDGHCLTVERWIDHEPLRPNPVLWEELGELSGRLHSLPLSAPLHNVVSRLDPSKTLDAVKTSIAQLIGTVPDTYRPKAEEYLAQADALGHFDHLPRTLIHSDLTWDNVVLHQGQLVLIDLEGAGSAPAVMDLVEVTTKLCTGESASGPIDGEAARAFYRGYKQHRTLSDAEIDALADAHFFQEVYYLENSLSTGDFDYLRRMEARLNNYRGGALDIIVDAVSQTP